MSREATTSSRTGARSIRGTPTRTVVICALPRSGSWLLSEALWRTGVAGRPEEYLRPDWRQRYEEVGRLDFQHRLHQQQPWVPDEVSVPAAAPPPSAGRGGSSLEEFLREVMSIGTTPNGVFALKCHWFQLTAACGGAASWDGESGRMEDVPLLDELFPSPLYVRLVREDKVRQAISWHRAISTDRWWERADAPPTDRSAHYDAGRIDYLQRWLTSQEESWDGYFERWGLFPQTVTYSELASNYQRTVARVLDELRLASPQTWIPPPALRKQADGLTEAWVSQRARASRARSDIDEAGAPPVSGHRPEAATRGHHPLSRGDINMRTSTILVDNFYANPRAVRDYALKQRYYHPYQSAMDEEQGLPPQWMASRFKAADACPFKSSLELIARLEEMTGDCVDLDHWNGGYPLDATSRPVPGPHQEPTTALWNCCFHLKTGHGGELSEGVHNHVTDEWNTVGEDGWSGLVYLADDPPLRGGLQTWRNVHPERDYDWMTPKDQWELIDDVGNVPNRLVLFRGSVPHSGTPGWGSTLEDGRLFQTFFFRVHPRPPADGVLAPV